MPEAFFTLLVFQLIGTAAQAALNLPVPGPVIGMFLLAALLIWRKSRASRREAHSPLSPDSEPGTSAASPALAALSRTLIACLGLLFVPAGVGIITELPVLSANALPIAVALFGSTILGLMVTALVMHRATTGGAAPEKLPDTGGQVL
ncbi:CidA/LrgA family protein [Acetobacter fallax]|uniref:CidA/LrgA family protein n=1 Tax=Acetobacter fallax TaxID=1737473 RepID=A0ABX0K6V8_9PROT|nr:CidA/LrgA family protein [Acetobacter fallax]NHO30996.1 CidA/LrgA family protein [Acetobacter fallax]NHO34553.1 CidA/LrgA family protein [Acetobacter fallax]